MTDSAQGRFVAQDAGEFVFHPPEKEEGDPAEKKLRLLRDRFRQLLKGSDFNEQDHPRADDGKFGSGGGGADSGKKPAGKKPAAKPAKAPTRTPQEVAAFTAKLKGALDSGALTPAHVPKIAAALGELTLAQLQEVKQAVGIKASGAKAAQATAIAQKALAAVQAKAKPAAPAKPAKPVKADAAKVHAGIADLLASGEPLNATHVAKIATALQGLSVKEIQAVKAKLGIKASGPKAKLAQSIAEKAVASVKAKPVAPAAPPAAAPPPPPAAAPAPAPAAKPVTPAQAIPAVHPAAIKLRDSLKAAKNLTPEQQAKHAAAIDTVIKRMPRAALDRLAKHVDSVDWHATTKDLTADLAKTSKKVQEAIGRGATVNGCYRGGDQKLVLNGDVKRRSADDIWRKDRENAHETYAHEMAHAVDGPKFEHSHSPEWVAAWKEEIGDTPPAAGQTPKLSKYATSVSHEGWAEFGRLVYGTGTDHAKIAAKFPKCFAYWKKIGVV